MTKKVSDNGSAIDSMAAKLPADFEEKVRHRFEKLKHFDFDFAQYLELEKAEFFRQDTLKRDPSRLYAPLLGTMTQCGNGDFEEGMIDPSQWQGGYGPLNDLMSSGPGNINFANLTAGLYPGLLDDGIMFPASFAGQSHQTWVSTGPDPYLSNTTFFSPAVNLPQTAPGSASAARIGNRVWMAGCELLSKTFLVSAANRLMTFWYALVLDNPNDGIHATLEKPYFMVRVTQGGIVVPGAVNFAGGNILTSDAANPFYQFAPKLTVPGQFVVYKDWAAAQIDLSSLAIGSQVTVEFVTADCWHGGHFGYAYIDRLCSSSKGSPEGSLSYDCDGSSHCGPGKICFDYELPHVVDPKGNAIIGDVIITLDIMQNGVVLTTLTSPVLTSGASYCFDVTPSAIPGINLTLGGFDFAATGTFSITSGSVTTNLGQIKAGTAPDGVSPGQNNDYQIACRSCGDIKSEQDEHLSKECSKKVNHLRKISCHCPDDGTGKSGCGCGGKSGSDGQDDHDQGRHDDCGCGCGGKNKSDGHHDDDKDGHDDHGCGCKPVRMPKIEPCISVAWGDSKCDCMETDDVEVMCITICNCYSNVTFSDLSIGQIRITDMAGKPVPTLPDGTPSVQVFPSGPICFGDIGPCSERSGKSCVSRELVVYTRGAIGKDYKLSFEGVCFAVKHHFQTEQCFVLTLCKDE
jgi:hypothetical protein